MTARPDRRTYGRLLSHARDLRREAQLCAEAEAYFAACVMAGAALEANLLATALKCEPSLREQGLWPKGNPLWWDLGILVPLAMDAGWLSVFDLHGGEGDEAAEVVWRLRNLVHPGAFVREEPPDGALGKTLYEDLYLALKSAFSATAIARRDARE